MAKKFSTTKAPERKDPPFHIDVIDKDTWEQIKAAGWCMVPIVYDKGIDTTGYPSHARINLDEIDVVVIALEDNKVNVAFYMKA